MSFFDSFWDGKHMDYNESFVMTYAKVLYHYSVDHWYLKWHSILFVLSIISCHLFIAQEYKKRWKIVNLR